MAEDLAVGTRVEHPKYGEGIISRVHLTSYDIIFIHGGEIQFSKSTLDLEVLERPEGASASGNSIDIEQVREIIDYALEKHAMNSEIVDLGEKWIGGSLDIKPSNPDLQAKEIPVEVFFHKIVMLRDRLRVLEQNINSHKSLNDEEKVHLQQYITRAYGSLTTFNLLFKDKEDYFKGAGKG
mgnify:CR=1 FL=1